MGLWGCGDIAASAMPNVPPTTVCAIGSMHHIEELLDRPLTATHLTLPLAVVTALTRVCTQSLKRHASDARPQLNFMHPRVWVQSVSFIIISDNTILWNMDTWADRKQSHALLCLHPQKTYKGEAESVSKHHNTQKIIRVDAKP